MGDGPDPSGEGWELCTRDSNLSTPAAKGSPGNVPPGEDLDLHIGWDRFEKLLLAVAHRTLGLRDVKFRRYGMQGQAQHGIDLAGRGPDGRYTVIQCKDYQVFTAGDLRGAVETFVGGECPFDAQRFIVATSDLAQTTQVTEELEKLQEAHADLELELWGSGEINEFLRAQGDVVARFWTRETAETFCAGAPLPGFPVPLPDRQEQADRVLVGPLKTNDVSPILQQAGDLRSTAPAEAARLYDDLTGRLQSAGFHGHAVIMRSKQLEALVDAELIDQAADLAAQLAVTALHFGDRDEARRLEHQVEKLAHQAVTAGTEHLALTQRHAQLVRCAVRSVLHPLGSSDALRTALEQRHPEEPAYQPLLVLLLAESLLASGSNQLEQLDELIKAAILHAGAGPVVRVTKDALIRLRLVRAEYDPSERTELRQLARRHQLSGRHAALTNAREARRSALQGHPEAAVESWRDAVYEAIHAGLVEDAADWLYAIRAVNVQYGPITLDIDDEHRLAQALRATGSGALLNRVRSPREHALSAVVKDKLVEASLSARQWLTDAVVTGSWASEFEALEFVGGLYQDSGELPLAAQMYQRAGRTKKLKKLAAASDDQLLPSGPLEHAPWWVLHARAALVEAQADLIDDTTASVLLGELTTLSENGRAGRLADSPHFNLTHQATRSACALSARGTATQARALLDLLAPDVPRSPNQYRHSDEGHATACVDIAKAHPDLAMPALSRLFDLADGEAQKALELVADDEVTSLLGRCRPHEHEAHRRSSAGHAGLTAQDVAELRERVARLDDNDCYLADVARTLVDPDHPAVHERAQQASDRILQRPEPQPGRTAFGTRLVTDAYLVASLAEETRRACWEKLLSIAGDAREVAMTRKDALTAVCNLVLGLPADARRQTFCSAQSFVLGEQDGSYLDDEVTGKPHPLSAFKISMGSASLRGKALRLAAASASTSEDHTWVRSQAVNLLVSEDAADLHAAALTLSQLPQDASAEVDAALMAVHSNIHVRQASAVLCLKRPDRYRETALRLAQDDDFRVRRALAQAASLHRNESGLTTVILELLVQDPRYSIRSAALQQTRCEGHQAEH